MKLNEYVYQKETNYESSTAKYRTFQTGVLKNCIINNFDCSSTLKKHWFVLRDSLLESTGKDKLLLITRVNSSLTVFFCLMNFLLAYHLLGFTVSAIMAFCLSKEWQFMKHLL